MPTILTFGDSNTHGTLPLRDLDEELRLGPTARWPGVALGELGPDWTLIEEGLPGRTTRHADPDRGTHMDGRLGLHMALESHGPIDVMTLMLGTNDLKMQFNMSARAIAEDVGMLLDIALSDEMQQRHDGFDILLICPPPVLEAGVLADMFAGGRAKSLQLPKPYAEVAKIRELAILNAGDFIESSPLDGVHFEADMHRKLGKAVAKAVLKMVG